MWYSPLLFGTQWMRLRGVNPKGEGMRFSASKMIVEFLCVLVVAFVLSLFTALLPQTVSAAIIFGLIIWVGFYVPTFLSAVLWEETPFGLFLINAGLRLVNTLAMSLVLVLWRP